MSNPFFSIVMPVYNRERLVERAIQSVLDQTFHSFEVIVVDDGSTDGTGNAVAKFKDARIKYFYKQNEERSIARNYGIERAAGQYVNFLDSDDMFYPEHLQIAHEAVAKRGAPEILHTGYEIKDELGKVLARRDQFTNTVNKELIFDNCLQCNSIFIKKSALNEIAFIQSRDAILSEDWFLWLRLAARYPIHCDNRVTSVVYEHSQRSLNQLKAAKVERSILLILENLEADDVFKRYYGRFYNRFKARKFCFIALIFVIENNKSRSLFYLKEALKSYPSVVFAKAFLAVLKKIIL
ncbi:glycosyltransferase family 2 protein [Fulvivirgaceae bacterium PWU4]|uniref:Glycosyltransferase family 2 protein n=1 Tax=Chryseosolibacter histidini TaxID=2782349 RepID=A0AAP2DK61_9BACT|nr:glycosyltransferase family A protein [Chryseosolibacter histidini]MBT1696492.1 glycosyltransferase family 2 protein [Chryseosolibacter histidini]